MKRAMPIIFAVSLWYFAAMLVGAMFWAEYVYRAHAKRELCYLLAECPKVNMGTARP